MPPTKPEIFPGELLIDLAPGRRQRRGRGRLGRGRQPARRRTERSGAGIRCAHRQAGVGIRSLATRSCRSGRQDLGKRHRRRLRRRQRLVGHGGRPGAGPGLPAHHQPLRRFLWRRPRRRQPLLHLRGGAEGCHRRSGLALPVRAPQRVRLRRAHAAHADRLSAQRQDWCRRWCRTPSRA